MILLRLSAASATLAALLISGAAGADDDKPVVPYAGRPLTLPRMTLSPRVDGTIDKLGATTAMLYGTQPQLLDVAIGVGASIGVMDSVELGVVVVPVQVLPNVTYGDPSLHGTFRVLKDTFELAANIGVTFLTGAVVASQIPRPVINAGAGVLLQPGLLSRTHITDNVKLDIGATLPLQLGSGAHDLGLSVPVELAVNPFDYFYVGLTTGFGVSDLDAAALDSYVPLGFLAGITIASNDRPVVDIGATFRWPALVAPGKAQKADAGDYQIGISVTAFVYLL